MRQVVCRIPAAPLGPEGPPLLNRGHETDLSAEDRILLGELPGRRLVPRPVSLLPYRVQNRYQREVSEREFQAVELSNEHLRATFLPELGGRLWSLVDLTSGRELLFQPDAIRYGNLALRDAWFSGGIEWNLGTTGHWGLTSSAVGVGVVDVDGEQVLRMWALERLTGLIWRLDAWLPAGSRHLFTSAHITNHQDAEVPFYWWSNAALPLTSGSRVLVPASSAFHNDYADNLVRVPFPISDGIDGSRPVTAPKSADYFFETSLPGGDAAEFPWIAGVGDDGSGLLLASSAELPGKKQFVWGNTRGGNRWQDWLNGRGRYFELQSGYTRTQKEHVALPPGQTVTWVEAFGPVQVADVAHEYDEQVAEVARQVPRQGMRRARELFDAAVDVRPEVLAHADGWGRVEVEAGHLPADDAVPFDGPLTQEQSAWLHLAHGGTPTPDCARSPLVGPKWRARLEQAPPGWLTDLLLGFTDWAAGDRPGAVAHWRASVAKQPNPAALHCLATAATDPWEAYDLAERAYESDPADDDLLLDYLIRAKDIPGVVLHVVDLLSPERRRLPRVRLAQARALIVEGRLSQARDVIDELELPNLRETSGELDELWAAYTSALGTDEPLPDHLDFRMH